MLRRLTSMLVLLCEGKCSCCANNDNNLYDRKDMRVSPEAVWDDAPRLRCGHPSLPVPNLVEGAGVASELTASLIRKLPFLRRRGLY